MAVLLLSVAYVILLLLVGLLGWAGGNREAGHRYAAGYRRGWLEALGELPRHLPYIVKALRPPEPRMFPPDPDTTPAVEPSPRDIERSRLKPIPGR